MKRLILLLISLPLVTSAVISGVGMLLIQLLSLGCQTLNSY